MHILSLQPYYGGSHQAFQLGWQRHSRHRWTILTLPPRHWKWRMRHAAVHFSEVLGKEHIATDFDAIFCSDFLNLAEFRGLVGQPWMNLPTVAYFHENQFAYPSRRYDERDLHFGFTNFTTCLAADQIWFNSAFNRDSFFQHLHSACQKWPDFPPKNAIESLPEKSRVQPPGIQVGQTVNCPNPSAKNEPLKLVWAARWEHDKNPHLLLLALRQLLTRNFDFRISIVGESFRRVPEAFDLIRQEFGERIDRWGFQSPETYRQTLGEADVFLSTADHEFFGIAAAEAIAWGAFPLLPDRLAYPEMVGAGHLPTRRDLFLYDGTVAELAKKLEYFRDNQNTESVQNARANLQSELIQRLAWSVRATSMDDQIEQIASHGSPTR